MWAWQSLRKETRKAFANIWKIKTNSNYVTKACKWACCVDIFFSFPHRRWRRCCVFGRGQAREGEISLRSDQNVCVDNFLSSFYCDKFDMKKFYVCEGGALRCDIARRDVQRHKFMSLCNTSFEYFPAYLEDRGEGQRFFLLSLPVRSRFTFRFGASAVPRQGGCPSVTCRPCRLISRKPEWPKLASRISRTKPYEQDNHGGGMKSWRAVRGEKRTKILSIFIKTNSRSRAASGGGMGHDTMGL